MKRFFGQRLRQRGAALILFASVMVVGVAWYAVGALVKAPVATPEREAKTGVALQAAKQALLSYVAQYAARSTTADPGQLPCPESLTLANPGESSAGCSATAIVIGRLPWKTLGIDPLYDGYGERLWYVMRGFRDPPINFGTPSALVTAGTNLAINGSPIVAMIIAPGMPRNTTSTAGTPPAGCTKQDQMIATRNNPSLVAANFLECGVATGMLSSPGDSTWTNDRVITITATEWADAVAPAVADRLQRQIAPAMNDYRTTTSVASWGQSFLPNPSAITTGTPSTAPETNNLCGNSFPFGDPRSGMPPTATVAFGDTCSAAWSGSSSGVDLGVNLSFGACTATASELRCTYTVLVSILSSPWINATAPNVGYSFTSFDRNQIAVEINGVPQVPNGVRNYTDSVSSANGSATIDFEFELPVLTVGANVVVRIPNPSHALLADARSTWWINNGWDRYTYYAVSPAATHDTDGSVCNPGGTVTGCMNVFGMSSPTNDKRLVLVLTGRALPGTTQPSTTLTNYWEDQNASVGVNYDVKPVSTSFNDRVAACPFKYQDHTGADVLACN